MPTGIFIRTEEHKRQIRKMCEANKGNKYSLGRKHTEEEKRKMSEALRGEKHPLYGKSHTEETKQKISKAGIGRLLSEKHKQKLIKSHLGKPLFDETKRKISESKIGRPLSEETRRKILEIAKRRLGANNVNWKGGPIKILCKLCGKESFKKKSEIKRGGNFCSQRCTTIYRITHLKNKHTKIEKLMEGELTKRNIPFTRQVPLLGITVVDFLLPHDTVIYCDGDYWHSKPKAQIRDAKQDFILTFYGYKVFRFTGTDIQKSPNKCIDKIKWGSK